MQFATIFITALATAASGVTACNSTGQKAKPADIEPFLTTVCAYISGNYVQKEQRYTCVTDKGGVKWDFRLKYVGSGKTRSIAVAECYDGMRKEASCERGGKTKYGNWEYSADPNSGACINTIF